MPLIIINILSYLHNIIYT